MSDFVIICVDDEEIVLNSLREELSERFSPEYEIEIVDNASDALQLIADVNSEGLKIPLIITDYIMPGMKGDEFLKEVHSVSPTTFKIMLTGHADLQAVTNVVNNSGLYRYIPKPWDRQDLALTVHEALQSYHKDSLLERQRHELIELNKNLEKMVVQRTKQLEEKIEELEDTKKQLEDANIKLERLSTIDGLTGIPNRRCFDDTLMREWGRASRNGLALSLLMIDVDYFKNYNDSLGHLAGDDCIRNVAKIISGNIKRVSDLVARFGGEEFSVILPGTDSEGAVKVAEDIRKSIESSRIEHPGSEVSKYVTVSIGGASVQPVPDVAPKEIIKTADEQLYCAKQSGRNRVCYVVREGHQCQKM